jgi:hypothetical protein
MISDDVSGLPSMDAISKVVSPGVQGVLPGFMDDTNATIAIQSRLSARLVSIKGDDVDYATLSSWMGAANNLLPLSAAQLLTRTQDTTSFFSEGRKGWKVGFFWGDSDRSVILSVRTEPSRCCNATFFDLYFRMS